jgi:hypothetical protein
MDALFNQYHHYSTSQIYPGGIFSSRPFIVFDL